MTFQPATACVLLHTLLLLNTPHVLLSADTHYDHANNVWHSHSDGEPFRTLWNVSLQECVTGCQLRKACRAINYCRTRLSCQLLETDSDGVLVSQNVTEEFNVYVRMSDARMTPSQTMGMSACSSCTVNQTCAPDTSSCVLTECRRLEVANGGIVGNMVAVGARVKVECADFYKLEPLSQDQSVCQADGQWAPVITCVPDTACGPPPAIAAATAVTFTNVSNVISAVYECSAGYDTPSAFNAMSVECLSNTTWGAIGFECLADCGAPPNVTLATVSTGDNLAGVTKIYACDTGHAVNGSATVTCQPDNTWSQIQFECSVDCGTPPAVLNGMALPGDTVEESVRNYTCNAGYAPNSTSTLVTCQMDGSWTAVGFVCVIDCGLPAAITNAEVSAGGTSEGDTRAYTCITGHVFRNLGNADITCQSDSTWSAASFDCLWDCGPAPNVSYAAVAVWDTVEASVGNYTCEIGYAANDTATITCQAGNTWSDVAFYCVVDCGTPGAITTAVISLGATTEGSTNSYTCATNYAAQNVVTMDTTCQPNGTWSTPSFDCVPDCGTPTAFSNAQVSVGGSGEGDTRSYSCDSGYVFRNDVTTTTTCQPDSTWSAPSFDCLWDCGATTVSVANADAHVCTDTVTDSSCTYTCSTGYTMTGVPTVTCQDGATWTSVAFSCDVDCGTPAAYPNAQVSSGGSTLGNTRTYTCVSGYVMHNIVEDDTTCQTDSTWSTPSFDCLYYCGAPPSMAYGTVSGGGSVPGSTRTYTCDSGYGTSGSATITCQDGTGWSSPTSTCTALGCPTGWYQITSSCYFTPGGGTGYEDDVYSSMDLCHSHNAYLLQLETQAESIAIESWFFNAYPGITVWLGISDEATEGVWLWMNSSVQATWTDWDVGQPNGGGSHNYCRLRTEGDWGDIGWDQQRQPLCEKSLQPT